MRILSFFIYFEKSFSRKFNDLENNRTDSNDIAALEKERDNLQFQVRQILNTPKSMVHRKTKILTHIFVY